MAKLNLSQDIPSFREPEVAPSTSDSSTSQNRPDSGRTAPLDADAYHLMTTNGASTSLQTRASGDRTLYAR